MTQISPELAAEQAYLDHARACLSAMRARAARNVEIGEVRAREEPGADTSLLLQELERRLTALADSPVALAFGRLDEDRGDRFYVGRRHIEDDKGDAVVVDWRAQVSIPFYRATWADPMGIDRRRRFAIDGRALVGLFDEDFADPDAVGAGGGGGVPDPLLAELERSRTGEMRDIVATIQAEQDEVIRAPLAECLVVQGGPGTGKTAVGLHRAAFLLFEHRDRLVRERLLVVGPNRLFLRYIAQVLPSLGETAVTQTTLPGLLASRFRVRATEAPEVVSIKGDARMAGVIARAARSGLAITVTDDVELRVLGPSPPMLVRRALGNRRFLAEAADGLLDAEEQAALYRRASGKQAEERWTRADLGLLDEAEFVVGGPPRPFGHVVVDEAQDHSAMELRLLARRSPDRSMTILGDLAQATATGAQSRWSDALAALDAPHGRIAELELGYRVPAPVLDFANRLLPTAAPGVLPSRSVRVAGEPPAIHSCSDAKAILEAVTVAVVTAREDERSVGIVAPEPRLDAIADALRDAGIIFADGRSIAGLSDAVTVIPPESAKGLEFDAVIVVEPAEIAALGDHGLRLLYIALTRAVRTLTLIHAEPLPAPLR